MQRKDKARLILIATYYAIVISLIVWFSVDRPPFVLVFWHRITVLTQRAAYRIGQLGLQAESAYYAALEKVKT